MEEMKVLLLLSLVLGAALAAVPFQHSLVKDLTSQNDSAIDAHDASFTKSYKEENVDLCTLDFDGSDTLLPKYAPILTTPDGEWVLPQNEDGHSVVHVRSGDLLYLTCPETSFENSDLFGMDYVEARCISGQTFSVDNFVGLVVDYADLGCKTYVDENVQIVGTCGPNNKYDRVEVTYWTGSTRKPVYETCFDPIRARSVWAHDVLYNEIADRDTGTSGMPSGFDPDTFFEFDVATAYSKISQRDAIAEIVGSLDLANDYVNVDQGEVYMARGHLAPRADFIYKSWQRSSYRYINTAPQWQCFNGGNWNNLENAVREMVEKQTFSPHLEVYTGTHGVLELNDVNNNPAEIWLNADGGERRLPVPKFYWKVLYEPSTKLGVALIGVNNPHMTKDQIPEYKLCQEIPNHPLIADLAAPEDIKKGVSYACTVGDARMAIPDIPDLPVSGTLRSSTTGLAVSMFLFSSCKMLIILSMYRNGL